MKYTFKNLGVSKKFFLLYIIALFFIALAVYHEMFERIIWFLLKHEKYKIDEIVPALISLILVYVFFALRRNNSKRMLVEEELREKAERLQTLYKTGKKLTAIISHEELLSWIAEKAAKLLHADACHYRIREEDYLVRGSGTEDGIELMEKDKLKIGESLSGWIAKERKPLIIPDGYFDDPRLLPEHKEKARKYGFRSCLGVPMCIEDNVMGVIFVLSKRPREFTEADIELLSAFADHSAIAIEKTMLYKKIMEKYLQFRALCDVNKKIASEVTREDLLPLIAEQAKRLLKADGCNFRLREGDELVRSYGTKESVGLMVKERVKIGESLCGLVAKEKKPIMSEDIREDERFIKELREEAKNLGFVSFVGSPMKTKDKVIGVINIFTKNKRNFSEIDIELLSVFADQAAIVIENSKHFKDLTQQIQQKVPVGD